MFSDLIEPATPKKKTGMFSDLLPDEQPIGPPVKKKGMFTDLLAVPAAYTPPDYGAMIGGDIAPDPSAPGPVSFTPTMKPPETKTIEDYTKKYPSVDPDLLAGYMKQGPPGFLEGMKRKFDTNLISGVELARTMSVFSAWDRMERGDYGQMQRSFGIGANPRVVDYMHSQAADEKTLSDFIDETIRDEAERDIRGKTIRSQAGEGAMQMVPFVAEILATKGLTAGVKKTVETSLRKAMGKYGKAKILKLFPAMAAQVARTAPMAAMQPGTYTEIAKGVTPELGYDEAGKITKLKEGQDISQAAYEGFMGRWVENLSEMSGRALMGAIKKVGGKVPVMKGLIKGLEKMYAKVPGATKGTMAKAAFEAGGFHGVPEEMLEERFGEGLRYLFRLPGGELPTLEQLAVEALTFTVPGVARAAVAETGRQLAKPPQITPEPTITEKPTQEAITSPAAAPVLPDATRERPADLETFAMMSDRELDIVSGHDERAVAEIERRKREQAEKAPKTPTVLESEEIPAREAPPEAPAKVTEAEAAEEGAAEVEKPAEKQPREMTKEEYRSQFGEWVSFDKLSESLQKKAWRKHITHPDAKTEGFSDMTF
ncbi:hypothetical protein KAR10_00110, partial [bacterium]|nr:hypothetical protein [bacterium]